MPDRAELYLTDMTRCEPAAAISDGWGKGLWHRVPYTLADGTPGNMLFAEPADRARPLTFKPGLRGWYRIFIGLNFPHSPYGLGSYGTLFMKLSSDAGFSRAGHERYDSVSSGGDQVASYPDKYHAHVSGKLPKASYSTIYESFWKVADMTGEDVILKPPHAPYDSKYYETVVNISSLRLVPATDAEIAFERSLAPSARTRVMGLNWCSGALTGHTAGQSMHHPTSRQFYRDEFEPFRNSDFGFFAFEGMRGGLCHFSSSIGDTGGRWRRRWRDSLTEFAALARASGMKAFISSRMAGASRPYSRHPINQARYVWERLQYSKRTREGLPCAALSLAFPAVRDYWTSLFAEALDHGLDGIQLLFNRCHPFVLFEQPVLDDFARLHGEDAREADDGDERLVRLRQTYTTEYLRQLRALLDRRPHRDLAVLLPYDQAFREDALVVDTDVKGWIDEGLVDILIFTHKTHTDYIRYFKDYSRGRVRVLYELMPRTQPGEAYVRLAQDLYGAGADGLYVWDCERRTPRLSEWNTLKHLGHREALDQLAERGARDHFRRFELKTHNGFDVSFSYLDG